MQTGCLFLDRESEDGREGKMTHVDIEIDRWQIEISLFLATTWGLCLVILNIDAASVLETADVVLIPIACASSEGSCETAQSHQSLHCSHT